MRKSDLIVLDDGQREAALVASRAPTIRRGSVKRGSMRRQFALSARFKRRSRLSSPTDVAEERPWLVRSSTAALALVAAAGAAARLGDVVRSDELSWESERLAYLIPAAVALGAAAYALARVDRWSRRGSQYDGMGGR